MIKLKMKSYNIILIEKQQIYLLYHQVNSININILPSTQQQIIEQTKFTYSPLGKAFDKQIETIEDQGKKQVDALEKLKPKETKPIEDKPNNQLKAATIFNDFISKRKERMNKLYDRVDYNNLKFEYVGSTERCKFL